MVHFPRAPALLGLPLASLLACAATHETEGVDLRGGCMPRHPEGPPVPGAIALMELDRGMEPCAQQAAAHDGFGEVEVAVRTGGNGELAELKVETTGNVAGEDVGCARAAARHAVSLDRQGPFEFKRIFVLGRAPPLLPPVHELFDSWRSARYDADARAQLAHQVPPAVGVSEDGCLMVYNGGAAEKQLNAWEETLLKPLPRIWQSFLGGPGLFDKLRPDDAGEGKWVRAYWLGKDTILLSGVTGTGSAWSHRVCLLSLDRDADARAEISARIARRGSCWSGKIEDVLLRPRTDFPADGRFISVASSYDRACAVDAAGVPVCCGAPGRTPPATQRFVSLALGDHVDCGLTRERDVTCWGEKSPLAGKTFAGPFDQISTEGEMLCALNARTHTIDCWNSSAEGGAPAWTLSAPRLTKPFGERRFIGLSTPIWGTVCGLTDDHGLTCRAAGRVLIARYPQYGFTGAFTSFSASPTEVCGVAVGENHVVRCWLTWPSEDRPNPPFSDTIVDGDDVVSIAQVNYQVCFLHRDQRITCWPGKAGTPKFPDRYRAITGGHRICAIDLQGAITCDRSWPSADMLDTKAR